MNDTPTDDPALAADSSALLGDDWEPVLARMDRVAAARSDRHLQFTADRIRPSLVDHSEGGCGCVNCGGRLDECPGWQQTQRVLLAWLLNVAEG